MSTFTQIKQIHILKNLIGLEEDLYREMLASFGVYSSKLNLQKIIIIENMMIFMVEIPRWQLRHN